MVFLGADPVSHASGLFNLVTLNADKKMVITLIFFDMTKDFGHDRC